MKTLADLYFMNNTRKQCHRCFGNCNIAAKSAIQNKWNPTIGLEIHAQISSKSKLFSGASTEFGKPVNSCVSFFDCATPGTLPVLNRRCVEAGVLTALALNCKINEVSTFDRKHYFYADSPAGYQITQQRQALAMNGHLQFNVFTPGIHKKPYIKKSILKQLQLEQDSGKSLHDKLGYKSYIDLNRAGVPLMELVFEPDLQDGEEAASLVKELMLILKKLDTCSCRMDEGALRVDANISVSKPYESLGIRTEVKNIGSVRAVAAAIKYEIERQIETLENGDTISNETRAWDVELKKTVPMREKEDKQDYRFMPEPNLPPLHLHVQEHLKNTNNLVDVLDLKKQIPEMPEETRNNLRIKYELSPEAIIVLVNEPVLMEIFLELTQKNSSCKSSFLAKILIYDVLAFVNKNNLDLEDCLKIKDEISELIDILHNKEINLAIFSRVLEESYSKSSDSPRQIIEKNNWGLINDEAELIKICQIHLEKHPNKVKKYKAGNTKVLRFFMGQIACYTNKRANMASVDEILKKLLE